MLAAECYRKHPKVAAGSTETCRVVTLAAWKLANSEKQHVHNTQKGWADLGVSDPARKGRGLLPKSAQVPGLIVGTLCRYGRRKTAYLGWVTDSSKPAHLAAIYLHTSSNSVARLSKWSPTQVLPNTQLYFMLKSTPDTWKPAHLSWNKIKHLNQFLFRTYNLDYQFSSWQFWNIIDIFISVNWLYWGLNSDTYENIFSQNTLFPSRGFWLQGHLETTAPSHLMLLWLLLFF